MADIAMCRHTSCIARDYCYRQRATPSQYRQSYGNFKPNSNVFGEQFDCDHFYSMQEKWFEEQDKVE